MNSCNPPMLKFFHNEMNVRHCFTILDMASEVHRGKTEPVLRPRPAKEQPQHQQNKVESSGMWDCLSV